MNDLRQAAQAALDFIKTTNQSSPFRLVPASNLNKTIAALEAALAEPTPTQGEPVAWRYRFPWGQRWDFCETDPAQWRDGDVIAEPLYLAAPVVPEGWKLVPETPTPEMVRQGVLQELAVRGIWAAMLEAAPAPGGEHE